MFEVLEGSWNELRKELDEAETLDDMIRSHEAYLDNILYLGLLGSDPESRDIQHLLSTLFDVADRFCAVQDRVFVDCLSELGGERARSEERQGRIRRGEWGYEGEGGTAGTDTDRKVEEYGIKSLEGVAKNAKEFEEGLKTLLEKLGKKDGGGKGEERIRFLTFRLDFNSFYQRKYEEGTVSSGV